MKYLFSIIGLMGLLFSCSIEPAEIEYGFDQCHFCQMTIVDQAHSAILVTEKGKSQKYDAIECMLRHMNREEEEKTYAMILAANYLNPGNLIDAKGMTFLISESIPSPMGGNLSAFSNMELATEMAETRGGELHSWEEVVDLFQ